MSNRKGTIRSALFSLYNFFFGRAEDVEAPGDSSISVAPRGVAPAETPEGISALRAIQARKLREAKSYQRRARTIGFLSFVATPLCLYYFGPQYWIYILPFGWMFMFEVTKPDGLSKTEYYSLPGTRDGAGKHVCFHCGSSEKEVHHYGRLNDLTSVFCGDCKRRAY